MGLTMGTVRQPNPPDDRGLLDTIALLRDGWPALIAFVCAGLFIGILATLIQPTKYRATATGVVSPARGFLDPTSAGALPAVSDTVSKLVTTPTVLMETASLYAQGAQSPKAAAERLRVATPAWLRAHLSVGTDATSSILKISATAPSQTEALQLAPAAGLSLAQVVNDKGQPSGATGIEVKIFSPPEANGKVSPTPFRNLLIGGDAGLILGVVAALAVGGRRRRLRRPEDIAAALGAQLIGFVRTASIGTGRANPAFAEARARLQALENGSKGKVLLVSGTVREDEIAVVAEGLARSLVATSARALLVDADLTSEGASRMLGIGDGPGFADTLGGIDPTSLIVTTWTHVPILDVAGQHRRSVVPQDVDDTRKQLLARRGENSAAEQHVRPQRDVLAEGSEHLSVLPAGRAVEDPASTLGCERLDWSLDVLRQAWDFVVVSGPALDRVAEVISLLRAADYVVLVAAPGASERELETARIVSSEARRVGALILDRRLPR